MTRMSHFMFVIITSVWTEMTIKKPLNIKQEEKEPEEAGNEINW